MPAAHILWCLGNQALQTGERLKINNVEPAACWSVVDIPDDCLDKVLFLVFSEIIQNQLFVISLS